VTWRTSTLPSAASRPSLVVESTLNSEGGLVAGSSYHNDLAPGHRLLARQGSRVGPSVVLWRVAGARVTCTSRGSAHTVTRRPNTATTAITPARVLAIARYLGPPRGLCPYPGVPSEAVTHLPCYCIRGGGSSWVWGIDNDPFDCCTEHPSDAIDSFAREPSSADDASYDSISANYSTISDTVQACCVWYWEDFSTDRSRWCDIQCHSHEGRGPRNRSSLLPNSPQRGSLCGYRVTRNRHQQDHHC
jgi:hypothetical protein